MARTPTQPCTQSQGPGRDHCPPHPEGSVPWRQPYLIRRRRPRTCRMPYQWHSSNLIPSPKVPDVRNSRGLKLSSQRPTGLGCGNAETSWSLPARKGKPQEKGKQVPGGPCWEPAHSGGPGCVWRGMLRSLRRRRGRERGGIVKGRACTRFQGRAQQVRSAADPGHLDGEGRRPVCVHRQDRLGKVGRR